MKLNLKIKILYLMNYVKIVVLNKVLQKKGQVKNGMMLQKN